MVNITRNIAANLGLGLRYAFMFKYMGLCTIGGCVCMGGLFGLIRARIRYGP